MTTEQTIEAFGEPSSRGLDECWPRRAADPPSVVWRRCEAVGESETLGPVAVMSTWVYPHEEVAWSQVEEVAVVACEVDLRFQGNKLVRWKVIRPTPPAVSSGNAGDGWFEDWQERQREWHVR